MSQLTAHIVYATYAALDAGEKEAFLRLVEQKEGGRKPPKSAKKSVYDKLPAKYHPDNEEMLVAEFMNE